MSIRAVLLLAALVPFIPAAFFRPFIGVLVWTVISFASPQWYAWGAADYFPAAELIAIPTILGFAFFSNGWKRLVSRESFLIVILWLWFTFTSIISSSDPLFETHSEQTWARWVFVSKVLLMTFMTIGIVDTFARLRILVMVTAACFSVYVVKALPFMIITAGQFRLYGPPHSMVEDNNDLGLALNMTLPLLFFLWQTESSRKLKRLFLGLFVAMIFGVFCTYSRGGLVGLVVVMGLMTLRLKQRAVLFPVLVLAVLIAALFAPEEWKDRMNLTQKDTALDQSAYSRLNAWTFSWRLAMDYPLMGGGFDTFTAELFDRYAPTSKDVHGPHSVYFGVLAEHGFIGLAFYLTLVVSCFLSARRIAKTAHSYGDEVAVGYAMAFRFSLIGFLTSGLFLGRAYFDYWFAVVAFIVILHHTSRLAWNSGTFVTGEPLGSPIENTELEYAG